MSKAAKDARMPLLMRSCALRLTKWRLFVEGLDGRGHETVLTVARAKIEAIPIEAATTHGEASTSLLCGLEAHVKL